MNNVSKFLAVVLLASSVSVFAMEGQGGQQDPDPMTRSERIKKRGAEIGESMRNVAAAATAKVKSAATAAAVGTKYTPMPDSIRENKKQAAWFAAEWTVIRAVPVAAVFGAYKLYKYVTAKKATKTQEDLFADLDEAADVA